MVRSDFYILYGYYCRPADAISSYRDLYVIQEKLNDLLENIQKNYEEIFLERIILFSDSDFINLGNFLNKRLSEFNLLMITPSREEMDKHILICWRSKKTGIYGTNIEIKEYNYFDAVLKHYYDARYQFIPYQIQDLLRFHGLSKDLISIGSQKRFAQHYELAILLNRLAIHYPQLKLIFASQDKAIFWTVKSNVNKKRIELLEEETITETPLVPYLSKNVDKSEQIEKNGIKLDRDKIPGKYEDRVFIGGNYDYMPVLREIGKYTEENGFQPILAYDFEIENSIHDFDLRLLHQCKYAIFDETHPAGELMEIERSKDYAVSVFIVYQVRDLENDEPPAHVSSMVTSLKYPMRGYSSFEKLKSVISEWLSEIITKN